MKKKILLLLTVILAINTYSQINFEKGYYIDNSNQKINCFIKNIDWYNNPTEFEYKLTEESDFKKTTIRNVKEFGIDSISKYVRSKVKIDRSEENFNYNTSSIKEPKLKEETLFLKVLIEGKSNLYEFNDKSLKRFFYSKADASIEQLIYKLYKLSDKVLQNNKYKQQLWYDLKCENFEINDYEKIDYTKSELVDFFVKYNECHHSNFINFEKKGKKKMLHLSIKPGFNTSSSNKIIDPFRPRIGVEAEFTLPFNKGKWAIVVEPNYQFFETSAKQHPFNGFEFPIGIRHYSFLKNNSKIFFNVLYNIGIAPKTSNLSTTNFEVSNLNIFDIGIGFKKNDKYSLELRYLYERPFSKDIVNAYGVDSLSLIFGYTFF